MLYELPKRIEKSNLPKWPSGVGSIPVVLPDGADFYLPVMKGVNVLTVGVVGTGKTSSYTKRAAEILLSSDYKMKGVFFETKRSFIDHFMEKNDKVISHNPNAVPTGNLFIPNIIKEIRLSAYPEGEMRELSEFLFSDLLEGANQNRAWVESARNTFVGILRTIVDCYQSENLTNRILIKSLREMPIEKLLDKLAKHPRNHSMLLKDWGYNPKKPCDYKLTKRAVDIGFFLNQALEKFSGSFDMDGEDTIHDWLSGNCYGRNLFFLYDLASAELCRPFFLFYLKKIKDYKLSNVDRVTCPILIIGDEIDKMAGSKTADFGLFQAATLGREFGLQILLTTQSIENLYGLSTDFNDHITTGGITGFPFLISFRPGDPTTISMLQKLYGHEYKEHLVLPISRYDTPVVKCELEPIVTEADFASLDTGDCIVKIGSHRPQKVHIKNHCND